MDELGIIQRIGGGALVTQLAEALTQVSTQVAASSHRLARGSVTVSLSISKVKGEPAVIIEGTIKSALPGSGLDGMVFYAVGGELTRTDPRAVELPLRVLPERDEPLRRIEGAPS